MTQHGAMLDPLAVSILREYEEMPGLKLTKRQVQRMWSLDAKTCDSLLAELQRFHVLQLTPDRRYALDEERPGCLDGPL
jgi:hypothetical protein